MMNLDEKIRYAKEDVTELENIEVTELVNIKLMINIYNNLYGRWINGGRCDEIIRSKLSIIELTAGVFSWPIGFNTDGYMVIEEGN